MKKIFLLVLNSCALFRAQAQLNKQTSVVRDVTRAAASWRQTASYAPERYAGAKGGAAQRGTAIPFVTESFDSAQAMFLPPGWTASNNTGSPVKWHWTQTQATGTNSIPAINSSTAFNGWMIYDADSAGTQPGYVRPLRAYLISPAYSCSGHSTVELSFQQFFRRFEDTCAVDVSNDGGLTWTHYPLNVNNSLGNTAYLPSNPHTVRINISAIAANKPGVKIRFNYVTNSVDGSYNWMVDDLALAEMEPVNIGITKSALLYASPVPTYSRQSVFSAMPLQFVTSILPFSFLTNYGINSQANLPVAIAVALNGASVYSTTITYPALPPAGEDSLVQLSSGTGYLPTATGSYTSVFSISPTGDAMPADNMDTFRFDITDTVFSTSRPQVSGAAYLHIPSTAPGGEIYSYYGSRFDIPVGMSDTATSVSVSFNSRTTPGAVVKASVYKLNMAAPAWDYVFESLPKTLTAADISTQDTAKLTTFLVAAAPVLSQGIYAVVVQALNVPDTASVLVNTTEPLYSATRQVGNTGQSSDATGDGTAPFASGIGIATGLIYPARITLNFGRQAKLAIDNNQAITISHIYPNPAANTVSVRLNTRASAPATISLSNTLGQLLEIQTTLQTATFNTSALASGVYFISITAGDSRTTRRFVVAH